MQIKREDILQVQYIRYFTAYHLAIYGSDKCLCGKDLGISSELFPIPEKLDFEKAASCKICLKGLKKIKIID